MEVWRTPISTYAANTIPHVHALYLQTVSFAWRVLSIEAGAAVADGFKYVEGGGGAHIVTLKEENMYIA